MLLKRILIRFLFRLFWNFPRKILFFAIKRFFEILLLYFSTFTIISELSIKSIKIKNRLESFSQLSFFNSSEKMIKVKNSFFKNRLSELFEILVIFVDIENNKFILKFSKSFTLKFIIFITIKVNFIKISFTLTKSV